jgi:hypothetical protein
MNLQNKNAFTILELLLVITLLLLIFGIAGFSFINNLKGVQQIDTTINKEVNNLSLLNQLSKQLFAKYEKKPVNIVVERDRLSFYTLLPVFFEGAVRAEYIFEKKGDKIKITYQEYPYVDGNLGMEGIKRQVIGIYDSINIEVLQGDRWLENYKGAEFPYIFKITINGEEFYINTRGAKI